MYDIIKHNNYVCVRPELDINSVTASDFKDTVLSNVHDLNSKTVIVDFSRIKQIDSIGCGIIIHLFKKLYSNNILLEITNVSKEIFNLFKAVRLDRMIKINCY